MDSKQVNTIDTATPQGLAPHHDQFEKGTIDVANADVALQLVGDHGAMEVSPALRKQVLRKIDIHVLSLLALTTMLQFLDKSTLSYAAIFGLIEDTHLVGKDYSWLASIFYFGYLLMQPIAAQLLQKFQAAKCLAASVFVWGVLLFMHVVCTNWGGLMAVRFLLGMAEGIVTPAFILISSAWYARQDQPLRMGIWFSFNGIAQIIGGLLSYGLGHIKSSIESWKWMFLITGALSIFWAVALWFLLPNHQGTAKFFTEEEKRASVEMVRDNQTGIHNKTFLLPQLKEALTDVKTWTFFWMALIWNVPNSIATFGSLVIDNFGFSALETTLLGMPAGALEFVLMIAITFICLKIPNTRTWCMTFALTTALVGSIIVYAAPYHNKGALLAGYYLIYAFPTGYILLLAMVSANTAGHTKKVATNAFVLTGYSVGNIIGPQFFKTDQKPRYGLGIGSCLVSFAILIAMTIALRFYLVFVNKRRSTIHEQAEAQGSEAEQFDFKNLTDKENPRFVYVY